MLNILRAYKSNDPAAKSYLEILFLYPGIRAIAFHRIAHPLYKVRFYFLARLISEIARFLTGIEIHPGAKIGKAVVIDHGMGVVIGETAEVCDNVLIYQGVTLGGADLRSKKRHPTIKENVILGAGSKIIGPVIVGAGSKVGANAVVLNDVAPNTSVGGVPAKILSTKQ
jgi:serine O-acetyltransferase